MNFTFWLTKYKCNSKCFVLQCSIGFSANNTTLRLHVTVHYLGVLVTDRCNSLIRYLIQVISDTFITAGLQCSAPVLERDTTCCFFDDHEMRLLPWKTQFPEVDFLSSTSDPPNPNQNCRRQSCQQERTLSGLSHK